MLIFDRERTCACTLCLSFHSNAETEEATAGSWGEAKATAGSWGEVTGNVEDPAAAAAAADAPAAAPAAEGAEGEAAAEEPPVEEVQVSTVASFQLI